MKIKGFTLIELLAVIVILAIIALIVVPIVLNIIGDTRISASKRSAENYIDAVELYLARSELDTNKVTLERNQKYNVTNSTEIGEKTYPKINDLVEISGGKPTGSDDYVQLNEKGKITDAKLTMSGYEVEIKDGKITSVKGGAVIAPEGMTLNLTEQTMEKNSTFKIVPTFTPINTSNQEVKYESSDTSIVTVDAQGNVIAIGTGIAKITVTSKENPNIKTECNITVVVSATGLMVAPAVAEIKTGETVQLTGTITPNNTTTNSLSWKSSNADIASVDSNGLVTGISVGEVIITATTVNGISETSSVIVKSEYKDTTGAVVELPKGLTPVVYSDNSWKVVSTTSKWYDYNNQEWANAVILNAGVTKNVGDTIDVSSEIKGMFVYVPRYEYKIEGQYGTHPDGTVGTKEQPGEIEVNFVSKETMISSEGYIMHPAFTFGSIQQSGIWIGKFETTGTAETPTILPSISSLREQNISEQFITAQIFNTYINNNSIDFHMSKNSEWGAAAYLSQSRYGKYGNNNYVGTDKQVMINNCENNITGVGADSQNASGTTATCTTNTYETAKGQAASTTGNVTGIYDMSGGAWEQVMGVYNKTIGSSGISTWPDAKYYDNYTSTTATTACNGGICYGHALSETGGWYYDSSYFVDTYPWIGRGGIYFNASYAGIFSFSRNVGSDGTVESFRIVLTES